MMNTRRGETAAERKGSNSIEGPSWGYPVLVLGAISSFLEPFRGSVSPKVDEIFEK